MSSKTVGGRQKAGAFEMTIRLRYLLFLPTRYGDDPDQSWPLILYLHGAGQRGDDLERVKAHGIPKIAEEQPDFPFVCVSPQCPDDSVWMAHNLALKGLLDSILQTYAIDPDRVYLTGNSMGGYGTWGLAMAYPGTFAAIAPICGGGLPQWVGALTEMPVWAFHGAEDPIVPLEQSQTMVDALKTSGGNVKLTVYPGVGHDSWSQTYGNPALYDWFLGHRRASADC